MFKEERTDRIFEYVKGRKFTTVDELVKWFNYSPATIRRDLTYLADLGLIRKSYGGVSATGVRPMLVREHENVGGKVRLCAKAAELVKDGDVIFVDGTTTTYFLGEKLMTKKGITIVTTNMKLAMFCGEHKIKCYVTGGLVGDTTMLSGAYAADTAAKIRYDWAFFSPGVIDSRGNIGVASQFCEFMKAAAANSKKNVLLCDLQKLSDNHAFYTGDVGQYDVVIFDEEFPGDIGKQYADVEFIIA